MRPPRTLRRPLAALAAALALTAAAAAPHAAAAPLETTLMTTLPDGGVPIDGLSARGNEDPAISADGRWALFESTYFGLASGTFGRHVYRRPTAGGPAEIVSRADGTNGRVVASAGGGLGSSRDGGRVLFASTEAGVVAGVDAGRQAYVRDVASGRTTLVSRADGLDGAPVATLLGVTLSADGRYVAFSASGDGIAPDVPDRSGIQTYLRDLVSGRTVLVSRADGRDGVVVPDPSETRPAVGGISPGGRFVTFSHSLPLDGGLPRHQLWMRDVRYGRTLLVSRAGGRDGAPATKIAPGPAPITADGCLVTFAATADHFAPGLALEQDHVFQRDLCAATTTLVDRADGPAGDVAYSRYASIFFGVSAASSMSADGRYVAFWTEASNLVDGIVLDDRVTRSFVRDVVDGRTWLISRASGADGSPGTGRVSTVGASPQLSADAGRAVFASSAIGLVPGVSRELWYIYQRELGRLPRGTPVDARFDDPGTGPPNDPPPDPEPEPEPAQPGPEPPPAPAPAPPAEPSPGPAFVVPGPLRVTAPRRVGAELRVTVSAAARVTVTVARRAERRRGGRVVVSWRPVARRTLSARARATLRTRLPRLAAGRYRVTVRARAGDGRRATATGGFRVAAPVRGGR
jgi:WD40-like Beta Propeller Repeat